MIGVDGGHRTTHLGTEPTDERCRQTFQHDDLVAQLPCRGRDLQPDEAGTDDGHLLAATEQPGAQRERIRQRTQLEHGWVDQLIGQAAGCRTGGDDEAIERKAGAIREGHRACSRGQPRGGGTATQVDLQRFYLAIAEQPDAIGLPLAGQNFLRQRRPVVGRFRLVADQGDGAGIARRTQSSAGTDPGERGTDDDDLIHPVHHTAMVTRSPRSGEGHGAGILRRCHASW